MTPVILYRGRDFEEYELKAVKQSGFRVVNSRIDASAGDLVIGRYSVLPYYLELERDLTKIGARLINSYRQHNYIADLREWYQDLSEFTPKTWFRLEDVPHNAGPFVVKGKTNSKKFQWNELMFAKDWDAIGPIYSALLNDGLIGEQDVYVRQYIPLKTYMTSFYDLPITDEYRFFYYKGQVISSGYYWSSHVQDLMDLHICPNPSNVPWSIITKVGEIVKSKAPFVAADFAQTADGNWILIELNDGQMSGLSENQPNLLYSNLMKALNGD